jgi:hypothetical protein
LLPVAEAFFLFLREYIHWLGSVGLWTRFYYLTKCGHDFTILAGCGHDFTVLVVGTCDVALFGCILAMVNDIIVCERKWWNNDDGKR